MRPFQGAAATWPSGWLRLQHYLRVEERFNFDTSDWSAALSMRSGYRLRAFQRFGTLNTSGYWMLFGAGEVFAHFFGDRGQFREPPLDLNVD